MNTSSEYTFPIFISSTDYNLKDLRAELAQFLEKSGYKAILSSAEGFPDSSPKLEPWESCLPVLEHSFVMTLVIDGKYGQPLKWPNFSEIFSNREVSPTHAEYIYAHQSRKRMFVFIRKDLMAYYQSYRKVMKDEIEKLAGKKIDKVKLREEVKKILSPTLPKNVDFKTLEFISEVKTSKPVPWIMEFVDVTDVKTKLQKKLLNELAEVFLIKQMRFDTVINALNKILDGLSKDEQDKALKKINVVKEFPEINKKIEELEKELEESNTKLNSTKTTQKKERAKLNQEIESLNEQIRTLKEKSIIKSSNSFVIDNGKITLEDYGVSGSTINLGTTDTVGIGIGSYLASSYCNKCENCDNKEFDYDSHRYMSASSFRNCPSCNKCWCNTCWPQSYFISLENKYVDICPECKTNEK
ncbi:MAG: DUF4062 domain-containing protein [Algicola sp.]|nr:DUF4062 domain-containing protein [Algicola sp.]